MGTLIKSTCSKYKVTRALTFTVLHCGFTAAWVPHTSRRFGSPGILLYTRMWFLHAKPWPYGNRKVNYHMLRSDITNMCCFPSKQCMGHFLMIFMRTIDVCMRKHPYTSPIHYHSYVHNTFSYKVTSNTPYHISHMPFWKVNYWWGIIEWQLWESLNKDSFATQSLKVTLYGNRFAL